jgi:LacI family transcriptional regulator
VVGANDDQFALHVEPPLTTVRLPVVAAGRRAAELIMASIGLPTPAEPVREMLTSELVVRASTQAYRGQNTGLSRGRREDRRG